MFSLSSVMSELPSDLSLPRKTQHYWGKWKRNLVKIRYTPPANAEKQLVLDVQVTWNGNVRNFKALIDTGAATPLVCRRELFPTTDSQPSVWPVTFITASGGVMNGGSEGLKLQVNLPVYDYTATETRSYTASCEPLWAYVAELGYTYLIIGHPFLEGFGLSVDPASGSLCLTNDQKIRRKVTRP